MMSGFCKALGPLEIWVHNPHRITLLPHSVGQSKVTRLAQNPGGKEIDSTFEEHCQNCFANGHTDRSGKNVWQGFFQYITEYDQIFITKSLRLQHENTFGDQEENLDWKHGDQLRYYGKPGK